MKTNALNFSVLLTLFISCSVLLISPGLVSLDAFQDSGAMSFIGLGLISMGLGLCLFLAMDSDQSYRLNWLLLAFVYLVYLMREADFHKAFSTKSLTKLSTYSMAEVPMEIRIISAIILVTMVCILLYFLLRYARVIFTAVLSGENWAVALCLWFLLLLSSQIFDRAIATRGTHWKLTAIEELQEVAAALFAVLAIIQFAFIKRIQR
jgi:heme/copper-type cytochrome/quinol oxidase subunit 4